MLSALATEKAKPSEKPQMLSDGLELHLLITPPRGEAFPLSSLESRLRCPACGSREVRLLYDVPREPRVASATA